ncbi:MAG: hypothetical protein Q3M24_01515 [Candidatus Electrothrix aestuarii]|uniref:Pepco domain-containing protein n=1 Tax=Candidatus Electrothrix aestuarii TaxID=3062594 RepID=A0AAU8LX64_9BACT|nr:hypothetical protein [Candidatus Electrothrix aestuarii]
MGDLPIYVEEEKQGPSGTLSGNLRGGGDKKTNIGSISAEKLRNSITALSEEFATIIRDTKKVGGFKLKEVQIQAGIDAKAGIVLIGNAGVKGSITLTFAEE